MAVTVTVEHTEVVSLPDEAGAQVNKDQWNGTGAHTVVVSGADSIVGLTGTKAEFDTALTDGDFVYQSTAPTLTGTNISGTAAGLTAGNATLAATVTTNANLSGVINSSGNVTSTNAQTGTGSVFAMQASPTLTTPVITNIVPGADFTLSQNSVAPFTSVNTGAIVNTLYLKTGTVNIGTTVSLAKFQVAADVAADPTTGVYTQLDLIGATNSAKRLSLGFNTTANYGVIQALENGVAFRALVLQPYAGNVGIVGVTVPTAKAHIGAGGAGANSASEQVNDGTRETTARVGIKEFQSNHYVTNWKLLRYPLGGPIFDYFADVSVGGAEADIFSSTLLANTFAINGDKVIASYGGNFVTLGTELTQLKAYFAGTAIWDSTGITMASGTSSWRVLVELIRVSSTVVRYVVSLNTSGASGYVYCTSGEVTGLTLTGTNILKITGTSSGVGSGSGDIVGKQGCVEYKPAVN